MWRLLHQIHPRPSTIVRAPKRISAPTVHRKSHRPIRLRVSASARRWSRTPFGSRRLWDASARRWEREPSSRMCGSVGPRTSPPLPRPPSFRVFNLCDPGAMRASSSIVLCTVRHRAARRKKLTHSGPFVKVNSSDGPIRTYFLDSRYMRSILPMNELVSN